jgi:type I restriction enzyme R subunit
MKTDTSEKGLETLIMRYMTGTDGLASGAAGFAAEAEPAKGGSGWFAGNDAAYDREFAVDSEQLFAFLMATQPEEWAKLGIGDYNEKQGTARQKFLARLQGEITRRGTIDVLRHGIKHGALSFDLFYGKPSAENAKAVERHAKNRFSVTRQLHFSRENKRSLDLCAFINGLPVITFELKNSLTKQAVEDAIEQYKRDRDPRETLFEFGRCVVHFAVDDQEVAMCTALNGKGGTAKDSWFLPFNQGWNDGAGNPPNPDGIKTDYLWKRILTPARLTETLENYAQIVEEIHPKTGRKRRVQIFPRYHQLDVVRMILADVQEHGAGKRYLIQHSAGSGKSNSIAWLAHQLISLTKDGKPVFDSIIVITDRRILDKQIRETIKGFAQVSSIIGAVKEGAGASKTEQLTKYLRDGKKLIISTVQTFPHVLDSIGDEHRGGKFAIIIDEAHSSQSGKTSSAVSQAVADSEDEINDALEERIQKKRLAKNASYFAFTATPKSKTLEMFGVPYSEGGEVKRRPFHGYTMKQASQEGFILDVLKSYTPVESYYRWPRPWRAILSMT